MISNLLLMISGLLVGLTYLLNKKLALEKYHPATLTALIQTIAGSMAIPFLFYQFKVPHTPYYWLLTLLSILAIGLGFTLRIQAYKTIDASVVGLIGRFSTVFAALFGLIFLTETYSIASYLGLSFILMGGSLVHYKKGKLALTRGMTFALLMVLATGTAAVLDKQLLNQFLPFRICL